MRVHSTGRGVVRAGSEAVWVGGGAGGEAVRADTQHAQGTTLYCCSGETLTWMEGGRGDAGELLQKSSTTTGGTQRGIQSTYPEALTPGAVRSPVRPQHWCQPSG